MSDNSASTGAAPVAPIRATNAGSPIPPEVEQKLLTTFGQHRATFFSDFFFHVNQGADDAAEFLEVCCGMLFDRRLDEVVRLTRLQWNHDSEPELGWVFVASARAPTTSVRMMQHIVSKAYEHVRKPAQNTTAKSAKPPEKAAVNPSRKRVQPGEPDRSEVSKAFISPTDPLAVRLYDSEIVSRKLDEELSGDSIDKRQNLISLYENMLRTGGTRLTKPPPQPQDIRKLLEQFPNFSEVVGLLSATAALSGLGNSAFRFPPLLLLGPPGVGKTYFATTLAALAGVDHRVVSMETNTAGWILSGSHRGWSGARVGKVAETLVQSEFANPIIVLDEVDKASRGKYDSLAPLYGLLEQNTASRFEDEFLDMPIDASHINWVLTSNSLSDIPEPIISRMTIVNVPAPSQEQQRIIVSQIYNHMRKANSWGAHFTETLSETAIDLLVTVSPRQVSHWLHLAFGRAAEAGRTDIGLEDLRAMQPRADAPPSRAIGFVMPDTCRIGATS